MEVLWRCQRPSMAIPRSTQIARYELKEPMAGSIGQQLSAVILRATTTNGAGNQVAVRRRACTTTFNTSTCTTTWQGRDNRELIHRPLGPRLLPIAMAGALLLQPDVGNRRQLIEPTWPLLYRGYLGNLT